MRKRGEEVTTATHKKTRGGGSQREAVNQRGHRPAATSKFMPRANPRHPKLTRLCPVKQIRRRFPSRNFLAKLPEVPILRVVTPSLDQPTSEKPEFSR